MIEEILSAIEIAFGVERDALGSPSRNHTLAHARFAAAALMYEGKGVTYAVIGSIFRRDPSTIADGIGAAHRLAIRDPRFAERFEYARKLAREAKEARLALGGTEGTPATKTPPAANSRPSREDETFEEAVMRASVNAASAQLYARLRAEVAG